MKLYKKIVLTSILLLPIIAQASGVGFYIPMAASSSSSMEDADSGYVRDLDYKSSVGLGFVYDSNVGMDEMYAYRLGLEYMKVGIDKVNSHTYTGDMEFTRLNMVHTFEFGLVTTKNVRFWVGPRINLAYQGASEQEGTSSYDESNFEFGIAPALGTNINLGSVVSLGFDVDYRFTGIFGTWISEDSSINYSKDGTNSGTAKGLTARLYVLFRFGETDSNSRLSSPNDTKSTPSYQNDSDSVIDDSL